MIVLMQWNQLNMKLEQVRVPAAWSSAGRNGAIFRDRSMQLTHPKVPHAKNRLVKLNTDVNNLNLQRLVQNLFCWRGSRARRWRGRWRVSTGAVKA